MFQGLIQVEITILHTIVYCVHFLSFFFLAAFLLHSSYRCIGGLIKRLRKKKVHFQPVRRRERI